MSLLASTVVLVAETTPDDDSVRPGPIAFGLFVAFAVATFLLWRSMNKHLKRVPRSFDGDEIPTDTGPAEDPPSATGAGDDDPDRGARGS